MLILYGNRFSVMGQPFGHNAALSKIDLPPFTSKVSHKSFIGNFRL
jgi:hypothetical protein